VRGIERVLGEKVERRTLDGFDYKRSAPRSDDGSARPVFKPQQGRQQRTSGDPVKSRRRSGPSSVVHQRFRSSMPSS
jgi:hypothetical protein